MNIFTLIVETNTAFMKGNVNVTEYKDHLWFEQNEVE